MAQVDLIETLAPAATPLAVYLAAHKRDLESGSGLGVYRGAQSYLQLDAPETETEALIHGAAAHDLGWMRRIAVRGEDRFRWLSGMVTNTVNDLAPNSGAWNLVLNAQGRIQGDLWVWREGDELELEIAAYQYDKLLAHLNHFIIMDDVELTPLAESAAIGLVGPRADDVLAAVGLFGLSEPLTQSESDWNGACVRIRRGYGPLVPRYELWIAGDRIASLWQALIASGATAAGINSLDAFRIAEGVPACGIDIVERDLPQETGQMRALHFNKGCYLGQEIVERIRSRGNVHRYLRPIKLTGPAAAGTELFTPGEASKSAGHITSAAALKLPSGAQFFALAMIRAEAEVGDPTFTYSGGQALGEARILAAPPTFTPGHSSNPDSTGNPRT